MTREPEEPSLIPDEPPPSKTRRKRDMEALQALGARLAGLTPQTLRTLPLTEPLQAALAEYRRLPNSHEARRRQLQFIGRLMRDADVDGIQTTLNRMGQPNLPPAPVVRASDTLADAVLAGGDAAIQAALDVHPALDRQVLRQFLRAYPRATPERQKDIRQRLRQYLQAQLGE